MKKIIFLLLFPFFALGGEQIDLNKSSAQDLDRLTGIGPAMAQRIIEARPYSALEDLLKVKGIGEKTFAKIKEQGLACVNCRAASDLSFSQTQNKELNTPETQIKTPGQANYPDGIIFNEILPSPKGSDETDEWIEIFNKNASDADLSGWQLKDSSGTATTYTFKNTIIPGGGYLVLKRPDTKIMLNNDGDGLTLYFPDGKATDSVSFIKAPSGQSYNLTPSGWKWSTTLTPGLPNIIAKAANKNVLPKSIISGKNNGVKTALADVAQNLNENQESEEDSNPWLLFITATVSAVVLGIVILFIKLRLFDKGQNQTIDS